MTPEAAPNAGSSDHKPILDAVRSLPPEWNPHGSFHRSVLDKLFFHASSRRGGASAETGTGKSTLLLSHLFAQHTVFTIDDGDESGSFGRVLRSDLLARDHVDFVIGPTQHTLPSHAFRTELAFVLIDGPHGYPFPELEYYFFYPHIATGGILAIDDIHIPTIGHMFNVLRRDAMWRLLEVERTTAFFERTAAPLFNPTGDGWWTQGYNLRYLSLRSRLSLKLSPKFRYALQRIFKQ
jgi:hypothetical protein